MIASGLTSSDRANDGLRLRFLTADDERLVRAGFTGLSLVSLHLRYGRAVRDAGRALDWVSLLGDGTNVAVGACAETGQPVGLARYVRQRGTAEVAVAVVDAWLAARLGARRSRWEGGMLEYELELADPQPPEQHRRPRRDSAGAYEVLR